MCADVNGSRARIDCNAIVRSKWNWEDRNAARDCCADSSDWSHCRAAISMIALIDSRSLARKPRSWWNSVGDSRPKYIDSRNCAYLLRVHVISITVVNAAIKYHDKMIRWRARTVTMQSMSLSVTWIEWFRVNNNLAVTLYLPLRSKGNSSRSYRAICETRYARATSPVERDRIEIRNELPWWTENARHFPF